MTDWAEKKNVYIYIYVCHGHVQHERKIFSNSNMMVKLICASHAPKVSTHTCVNWCLQNEHFQVYIYSLLFKKAFLKVHI